MRREHTAQKNRESSRETRLNGSSDDRIRTCDPVINSHLLCQLSYVGIRWNRAPIMVGRLWVSSFFVVVGVV